jgi:YHS domain-containing protein
LLPTIGILLFTAKYLFAWHHNHYFMQSIKIGLPSFIILAFAIASCSDNQPKQPTKPAPSSGGPVVHSMDHGGHGDTAQAPIKKAKPFAGLEFADKKDLVCGMPLTAGIEDTASYKGKLYGFCATGCKEDFVKNPKEFLPKK